MSGPSQNHGIHVIILFAWVAVERNTAEQTKSKRERESSEVSINLWLTPLFQVALSKR